LEAARVVTGATCRCPTEALYRETGWEKLSKRRDFHRALLLYKIENNLAPAYLCDLIPDRIQSRTRYNLRNRNDLQVPYARLATYSQSFFPAAARSWNTLQLATRMADTDRSFKTKYLKEFPRPVSNTLYYFGSRIPNIIMAKMRIGCSMLRYDLCNNLHVIQDQNCPCIMGVPETYKHFFTECPWFMFPRVELYANLINIPNLPPINANMLLYGDPALGDDTNILIFTYVHKFITDTTRFQPQN
jgi:hypothetical protein